VVLHSGQDRLISVQDSFDLIRLNPPRSPQERAYFAELERGLLARGLSPHSQRLLIAGTSHRCVDPDALEALAGAAAVLLETPRP
jgi:hypothetical protein